METSMADEKKPKIDLKARLGKGAPTPTPAPVGSAPIPASQPAVPPPGVSGPGLPVPPGVPVGAAPIDPSNPLAAVVAPRPMSMPAPQHAQRIEVDEVAVQQAAAGARKTMGIFAVVALVIGAGVGFVGGQAKETGAGRDQARSDAKELKTSVDASKTKIEDMATKLEAGVKQLTAKEGKAFPKDLANQLGAINVDFDGTKLAGRRFAGFKPETSGQLFDYVTNVSALNTHKTAVKNLLTKLEKPITEQITAASSGQHAIQYVVLLGGTSGKDPGGNYVANIAALNPPLSFTGENPAIPNDIKANFAGQNVGVTKYKGGAINEPSAIYVTPGSFDAVCPSETKSAIAQLAIKLGDLINEIRGEPKTDENEAYRKPGLLEQADTLSKGLENASK
jgi:hypothetical protein